MRILNIVRSMNPETGGPCKDIRDSAILLNKLNIKFEVLSFDNGPFFCDKDLPFNHYFLGEIKNRYGYTRKIFPWLKKNIDSLNVIILHGMWQLYEIDVYRFMKSKKNSLVYYVKPHGMLDPWFQNDPSRKLKALRNRIYWKLIERRIINSSSGLLFGSEIEKKLATKTFKGYSPLKSLVVGNFVNRPPNFDDEFANDFYLKVPVLKRNEEFALFLSRIDFKKGIEDLIYAWEYTIKLKKLPKLLIAGPIDNIYAKKMINLVRSLGLSDQIIFSGMLDNNAKWGAFYLANIFILPSHQENYGIAVVESLACGCPVFITNKINIYPYILEGNCGIVFEDNVDELKKEILNWDFKNLKKRDAMSRSATKTYELKFNPENTARNYCSILKQDLKNDH